MIKFFRHIRKSLLTDNKFSKYLLYAIGEIILVVIGIIIALQINNWNEARKLEKAEQDYLTNLHTDIQIQLEEIDAQLDMESSYAMSANFLLDQFQQKDGPVLDSIFYGYLSNLTSRKTFKVIDATYTELISAGQINILQDKGLKNKVIAFYEELKRAEKIVQNNNTNLIDQLFLTVFIETGNYYYEFPLNSLNKLLDVDRLKSTQHYDPAVSLIAAKRLEDDNIKLKFLNALKIRQLAAISNAGKMAGIREEATEVSNLLNHTEQ